MKKIQLLLAVLAFFTASVGVYASEVVFATQYYEDTAVEGNCDVQLLDSECDEGGLIPCQVTSGNNVWKRVDGGDCIQVFRMTPP